MFTRTAHAASAVRQALNPACARQVFGALRPDGTGLDDPLRIRFDRIEEDRIYVDLTPSIDLARTPAAGGGAAVCFFMGGYRYVFETLALAVLNGPGPGGRPRAVGLVLAVPTQVSREQRRTSFRVSVAAHNDLRVVLCPVDQERSDCCPIHAKPLKGRMVNLAAGGLCAVVQTDQVGTLHALDRLFIEFRLPDANDDFLMVAQVRHLRPLSHGVGALVGLRFERGLDRPIERLTQAIAQFVTREERRRLRRKR